MIDEIKLIEFTMILECYGFIDFENQSLHFQYNEKMCVYVSPVMKIWNSNGKRPIYKTMLKITNTHTHTIYICCYPHTHTHTHTLAFGSIGWLFGGCYYWLVGWLVSCICNELTLKNNDIQPVIMHKYTTGSTIDQYFTIKYFVFGVNEIWAQ